MQELLHKEFELLREIEPIRQTGRVKQIIGLVLECEGLTVPIGSLCLIKALAGKKNIRAEVVGFREDVSLLMPLGDTQGIRRFDEIQCISSYQTVGVGDSLLGRILDAEGKPIDDGPPLFTTTRNPIYMVAPHPLKRELIEKPLATGIRSIDALLTCGKGQRLGLFAGSGVGKSVLMGMIVRNTSADVSVVCLVGERGREVREFIERDLGVEGLKRSVVIVATSEQSALLRVKAPFTASAIAEYFRDHGKDVLLFMDSITRMANSQREIGLSAGEPPATRGYPPSMYAMMPKLLERAGNNDKGSITGIYTVLVEADDMNEPIADHARSILDGHIWLSRELATRGHYPAIDPLVSISRLMISVVDKNHLDTANRVKAILETYREHEDMINIGAYVKGSSSEIDAAIKMINPINNFLRQDLKEKVTFEDSKKALLELVKAVTPAGSEVKTNAA
ncbi:FliI/YscN family ATPase [Candidatus Peregrinibacteria bacterium]|nr:FliI/YscN family ATPase [Candidatus Peregrinibacteria bacterium]